MAFKYLNKCAVKLKTPELLKEAFESYCKHIASGYPKEAWFFEKDGVPMCGWRTIETHIEEMTNSEGLSDVDLSSIKMSRAESARYKHWYDIVIASANGKNQKANTASLQMAMRNMFGWDAKDDSKEIAQKVENLKDHAQALANDREQHAKTQEDHSD